MMLVVLSIAPSAQQNWTGTISDSSCKAHHEPGGEAGLPDKPNDCVLACVRGGSKFVFVTEDKKVFLIAKQDDPVLQVHAAAKVTVTGSLANDVLTISKIEVMK
jgi:hypothetical protein